MQAASLVYCYSRLQFFQMYPRFTRFECKVFLDEGIRYAGGTAGDCMIDNTSVVRLRGAGADMVPVQEMVAFGERYGFRFIAHEVGDANRSARVEGPFDGIERNFLAGRRFTDWEHLNQEARLWCDRHNAKFSRKLHASRRELFAVDRLQTAVVETNAGALVDFVRGVGGTRRLCMEEGTMSEWLHEVLSPHVEELVVLGIPPGKKKPKSDARDALGLANQLRLGNVELSVYKGHGAFRQLRELSRVYITDDVVRVKNRLKAMYRSRGIATSGRSVFQESCREEWLKQLPETSRPAAEQLYAILDAVEEVKATSQAQLAVGPG
ncbi:MAG: hypothetical protein RBU30_00310 [Polyangia bacterium]|nr:hypothetical protein [Polyangia bacterium]